MTAEERARGWVVEAHCAGGSVICRSCEMKLANVIRAAETIARSEGRLAGLREAARLAEALTWLRREDREFLKAELRRLAEDVPKAPSE